MFETMRNQASAAAYLGLKPTTLQDWRSRGTVQLPFVKIGSRVFYRQADLDSFLESIMISSIGVNNLIIGQLFHVILSNIFFNSA